MTTLIAIFILSLAFSLILTPLAGKIARKYNIFDMPSERNIHSQSIPRIGGLALYVSFFIPFFFSAAYPTSVFDLLTFNFQIISLVLGSSLVFALGLWDDMKRLKPIWKFAVQVLAASIAYAGGMKIDSVALPGGTYSAAVRGYCNPWHQETRISRVRCLGQG